MKKFIKEHTTISIIVVSILLILLIVLAIYLATRAKKNNLDTMTNAYTIRDEVVQLPGTKVISNDNLKSEQCLDDVCVSNVVIHSTTQEGRVECTITNRTQQIKSGFLKLIINDKSIIVGYKNLEVSAKSTFRFSGYSLQDATSYTIAKLSDEELKTIKE